MPKSRDARAFPRARRDGVASRARRRTRLVVRGSRLRARVTPRDSLRPRPSPATRGRGPAPRRLTRTCRGDFGTTLALTGSREGERVGRRLLSIENVRIVYGDLGTGDDRGGAVRPRIASPRARGARARLRARARLEPYASRLTAPSRPLSSVSTRARPASPTCSRPSPRCGSTAGRAPRWSPPSTPRGTPTCSRRS